MPEPWPSPGMIVAGQMAFTLMLNSDSSIAHDVVSPLIACFEAT